MTRSPARHGTPSGYQAHRRRDEQPCDACYRAWSAYHAGLSAAPERQRLRRRRARAQHRALQRLKNAYPGLYRLLYEEEVRALEADDAADAVEYATRKRDEASPATLGE